MVLEGLGSASLPTQARTAGSPKAKVNRAFFSIIMVANQRSVVVLNVSGRGVVDGPWSMSIHIVEPLYFKDTVVTN
jgi:hypothetical protein